ncbi:MAG: hypothetical protein J6Y29_03105 [Clostridiales bacterium]|nr:hypothetical protein [Clostridiales bacterium]
MLEVGRDFDNVAYIQSLIKDYKNKECKLKHIINNLNLKKKVFSTLDRYYNIVCSAKEDLCLYEKSFWFRHLRFLPKVKDNYDKMNSRYISSLAKFKSELNKRSIVDEKEYHVMVNNFKRNYAKLGNFESKLCDIEKEREKLTDILKSLNVRVFDEYLFDLPKGVLSVVKSLPSEQVLVLKNLNLPRVDYKSLSSLYDEYSMSLAKFKEKYLMASRSLVSFSNASHAISLYKRACLDKKLLSAEDGKKLVTSLKSFMHKHNIRNMNEINDRQLELKKEMDLASQNIEEMSTKMEKLYPLIDKFKDIDVSEKGCNDSELEKIEENTEKKDLLLEVAKGITSGCEQTRVRRGFVV